MGMTNRQQEEVTLHQNEEVAALMMMGPATGASCDEAPAMQRLTQQEGRILSAAAEEENNGENVETELVLAAAKAVKRVRCRAGNASDGEADETSTTEANSTTTHTTDAAPMNEDNVDDDEDDYGRVCYTKSNTTMIEEKENETQLNEAKRSDDDELVVVDGVTVTTASAAAASAADDDKDYVGNSSYEEENGTYKTTTLATFLQSEPDIIQKQQDQGINALISNISLFLVETWNWLHYFFVTIIFLNLVHFADRRSGDSVVGEEIRSVEVDGSDKQQENDSEDSALGTDLTVDEEEGEEEEDKSGEVNLNTEITTTKEEAHCENLKKNLEKFPEKNNKNSGKEGTMSPNTCSIQNQQDAVEQAQEAIVAVAGTEKAETLKMTGKIEEEATTTAIDNGNIAVPEIGNMNNDDNQQQQESQQPETKQALAGGADVDEEESDENTTGDDDMDSNRRDSVDSCTSSDGNMGDTEDGSENNKSSDEKSIDGSAPVEILSNKEVAQKIIAQVESMFSDEHLAKDGFLLKHVRRRSDGFVSLKLVAGLRKVKQISREFPVVLDALKDSKKLEINSEGTKVRRVEPLTPLLKSLPIKSKEKETKQTKEKDNGSSNDENQQPSVNIQANNNKSASKTGNKENDNGNNNNNKRGQNRRNSTQNQNNANNSNNNSGNQSRRNSNSHNNNHHQNRKSSNASTTSSNGSRHNSFSKAPPLSSQPHPADLLRNVYTMTAYSSSGEECQSPQAVRRRGGSLPIAALQRSSAGAYLSPNSSPPNHGPGGGLTFTIGPNGGARPKSNSYCEGAGPSTMSPWLQRRKASASSRLSQGELIVAGVIRQPRGPDGTKGFPSNYRAMILQERLQQQKSSAVSA